MTPEDYSKLLDTLADDDMLRVARQAGGICTWTPELRKQARGNLVHEYRQRLSYLKFDKTLPWPQRTPAEMVEDVKMMHKWRGGQA